MTALNNQPLSIQFYWDIGSTNSYFAFHLLRPIAKEFGAVIEYIPLNLGYVFRHHNYVLNEEPKSKLKNRGIDLQRWARKYGLPFNVPQDFPIKTSVALRGSLVMRRFSLEEAYIQKLFTAYWEENNSSIKGIEGIVPLVTELGVARAEFVSMVDSNEIRQEFIDVTQLALSQGILGAPIMVVQDEIYWGKDRFDFIREHLARITE